MAPIFMYHYSKPQDATELSGLYFAIFVSQNQK